MELYIVFSVLLLYYTQCVQSAEKPRIRHPNGTVLLDGELMNVLYGDSVELFCTEQAQNLKVVKFRNGEHTNISTTTVNETTITFFLDKPERDDSYYCCRNKFNEYIDSCVNLVVDSPPETRDFRCISKSLDSINCTWTSPNVNREFSLYRDWNGVTTLLCKLQKNQGSMNCLWDSKHPLLPYERYYRTLNFLMKTCNSMGCAEQKFEVDHLATIKLDPPNNVMLLRKTSYSAALRWEIPYIKGGVSSGDPELEHKISYWYSGIYQHQVNASTIKMLVYYSEYEVELKLPCAGTFYEVRVSIKRSNSEYWSEDAVISFVTDPEPKEVDAVVDPTCNRPRVKITSEIMLFEIDKFRTKVIQQQNVLKERIRSLTLKINQP